MDQEHGQGHHRDQEPTPAGPATEPAEASSPPPDRPAPASRPAPSLSEAQPLWRMSRQVLFMLVVFLGALAALLWALSGIVSDLLGEPSGPATIARPTTTAPPATTARPTTAPRTTTAVPPPRNPPPAGASAAVLKEQYKTLLRLKMRLQRHSNDRRARRELQQTCRAHLGAVGRLFGQGGTQTAAKAATALLMLDGLLGRQAASLSLTGQATVYAVQARALDTSRAGRLWVISGKVTNDEPRPVGGMVLRAVLLGPDGREAGFGYTMAGNTLSDAQLRSLTPSAIQAALLKEPGRGPVTPGTPLRFMFVFRGRLPASPRHQVIPFVTWPAGP